MLDAYGPEDKDIFFGREKEVETLYQLVFQNPLVLVYGLSGTGKTSLIQCGLAGRFDGADWYPFFIRRGNNINESLRSALVQAAGGTERENLGDYISHLYRHFLLPVYLIFDQFEELFLMGPGEEQEQFILGLKELLSAELPCRILLVMREEYIGALNQFEKHIPTIFDFKVRVEPMNANRMRRVVDASFDKFNIGLETPREASLQLLMSHIGAGEGVVQLPYLQVYLDGLYQKKSSALFDETGFIPLEITRKDIEGYGRMEDALQQFLEAREKEIAKKLIRKFPDVAPDFVSRVLDAFVTESGTKRPVIYQRGGAGEALRLLGPSFGQLQAGYSQALAHCLELLEKNRILRFTDDLIELAHDSLAAKIDERRTSYQRRLNEVRKRLLSNFEEHRQTGEFLTRKQLALYEEFLPNLNVDAGVEKFLRDSEQHVIQQERKGRNRLLAFASLMAIAAIVSLTLFGYAEKQRSIAEEQRAKADSTATANRNAVRALQTARADPVLGLQMAAYNFSRHSGKTVAASALHDIISNTGYDFSSLFPTPVDTITLRGYQDVGNAAVFSKDRQLILIGGESGSATLWNRQGDSITTLSGHSAPALAVAISPGKALMLTGSEDNSAILWDQAGQKLDDFSGHQDAVTAVAFSPDNQFILSGTAQYDKAARLWPLSNKGEAVLLAGHTGQVTALAFTPNGQFILTGSVDQSARLWDLSGQELFAFRGQEATITSLAVSPDGKYLLSGGRNGTAVLWNIEQRRRAMSLRGHADGLSCVAFSAEGNWMLTGSEDGVLKTWTGQGSEVQTILTGQDEVLTACFSQDQNKVLAVTTSIAGRLAHLLEYPSTESFLRAILAEANLADLLEAGLQLSEPDAESLLSEDHAQDWLRIANYYFREEQWEKASLYLERIIQNAPARVDPLLKLYLAKRELGEPYDMSLLQSIQNERERKYIQAFFEQRGEPEKAELFQAK